MTLLKMYQHYPHIYIYIYLNLYTTLATYIQQMYLEVLILFYWDMQKYLKDISMKLLRSYKQGTTTWFVYSCLFQYVELDKIYIYKDLTQHTIDSWMRSIPSITMRTKYEDK